MSFTLQVYPVPCTAPSVPFTDEVVAQVPPPSRPRRMVDRLRRRRDNESASYLSNDGLRERREYAASPVWSASTNTLTIRVHGASMIVLDEATDITIQADEVLNVVVKPHTRSEGGVLEITHVCLSTITTSATPWRVSVACTTASALQELHTLAKLIFNAAFPFGPRHYIALAAPTSGSGRGPARWEALCETLLQHTPHTWTTVLTTHRCHAEELAATMDLRAMDVLVAVGGDGMVHEVVNGFAKRTTPLPSDGCPHVAHLPAGSGCAFAKCFNMVDQVVAMLGMIHCKSRAVDVIDVTITDNNGEVAEKRKITLAALFSVMAAVDFESEWLRALGNGRFIVDVVRRVLGARIFYPAHVSYKPATLLDIPRKYWLDPTIDDATAAAIRLDGIEAIAKNLYKLRFNGEAHTFPATSVSDADSAKAPPLNERGWVDIPHDSFALLYVCNLPWVAQDWLAAPFARSDDGCIDLHYTNVSLTRLQWTWAIPDFMSGECVAHRRNRLVKCKEVIVDLCEGYGSLDGERCPLGKLHFRCLGDRIDIMTGLTAVR